jgi:hypothetical protein
MNEEEKNAFREYLMTMSDEDYTYFKEKSLGLDRENLYDKIIQSTASHREENDQYQYYDTPRIVKFFVFDDVFPNAKVNLTFVMTQPIEVYFYIDSHPTTTGGGSQQPADGRRSRKFTVKLKGGKSKGKSTGSKGKRRSKGKRSRGKAIITCKKSNYLH